MENILINGFFGDFTGSERVALQNANLSEGKTGKDEFLNVLKDLVEKDFGINKTLESTSQIENAKVFPVAVGSIQDIPLALIFDETLNNLFQQQSKPMTESGVARMNIEEEHPLIQSSEVTALQTKELLKKLLGELIDRTFSEKQKPDATSTTQKYKTDTTTVNLEPVDFSSNATTVNSKPIDIDSITEVTVLLHQVANILAQQSKPMTESGVARMNIEEEHPLIQSSEVTALQTKELLKKLLGELIDRTFSEKQKPDATSTTQKYKTDTTTVNLEPVDFSSNATTVNSKPIDIDSITEVTVLLHQVANMLAQQNKPMTESGVARMNIEDVEVHEINMGDTLTLKYVNDSIKDSAYHSKKPETNEDMTFKLNRNTSNIIINNKQVEVDIQKNMNFNDAESATDATFYNEKNFDKLVYKIENILKGITVEMKNDVIENHTENTDLSNKEIDTMAFLRSETHDLSSDNKNTQIIEKASFVSTITDKIVKVTEQLRARNTTMDMVMRMNINEKESLLIGFKREGQQIFVEIKTESSAMLNLLQESKDTIVRNLEMKNVNANIFLNPDGKNSFERREGRREGRRGNDELNRANGKFYELFKTEEVT
ncbi:MAG TPA: hypothetical protein PLL73_07570 [Syntrophorhabdaceae bacterium]|nr:hypothetical protein [Syntrophorhabdaceae bacterium]